MSPTAQRRLLASLVVAALVREAHAHDKSSCLDTFEPPEKRPGEDTTIHNGVALQDVCISHDAPYHVFVLGDWGGTGDPPQPAINRGDALSPGDWYAQQRVADRMNERALNVTFDYLLNVGDSFYWAGIERTCFETLNWSPQWSTVWNDVYTGPGLQGKPWLGVLGNHDYGGFKYNSGWGQIIAKSWVDPRWLIPAQYYSSRVHYPDFSVDYYFLDSNVFTCNAPDANPGHNMCSLEHNGDGDDCTSMGGPDSTWGCPGYFDGLWRTQLEWLSELLAKSTATWRIVVTHIPPMSGGDFQDLAQRFGIDLVVCGHVHYQRLYTQDDPENPIAPTGLIVSGGGGGITTANIPDVEGNDDQYGFVDLALSKDVIGVEMVSHGGQLRASTQIEHCYAGDPGEKTVSCGSDQASGTSENKTAENETAAENETSQASAKAAGVAEALLPTSTTMQPGGTTTTRTATTTTRTATSSRAPSPEPVAHEDDVDADVVDDSKTTNAEEPEPTIFTSFLNSLKGLLGQSAVERRRIALRKESHPDVFSLYLMASVAAASSVTLSMVCWVRRTVARRRAYSTILLSEAA